MTEGSAFLAIIALLLACGVVGGAVLGYLARRAGQRPGAIGWLVVVLLVVGIGVLGDRFDRAFSYSVIAIALLGWPIGGIIGERAFNRRRRAMSSAPLARDGFEGPVAGGGESG